MPLTVTVTEKEAERFFLREAFRLGVEPHVLIRHLLSSIAEDDQNILEYLLEEHPLSTVKQDNLKRKDMTYTHDGIRYPLSIICLLRYMLPKPDGVITVPLATVASEFDLNARTMYRAMNVCVENNWVVNQSTNVNTMYRLTPKGVATAQMLRSSNYANSLYIKYLRTVHENRAA